MCVHLPFLAIEQEVRRNAWPPHRPIVLTERFRSCERVWRCNEAALLAGIRPTMPLTEARAVAPSVMAAPHRPEEDRRVLDALAAWAECLSPVVQPDPPDSLLVDVTGCQPLFRGESNLLRVAVEGIRRQGFSVRGAIADTVGTAWAVAHEGDHGPMVVPPGQSAAALAVLPPRALRLSPRAVDMLDAVGVGKIETLLHLPRSALAARLGEEVARRIDQALGTVPEVIQPHRPPADPVSRIRLAGPTDRLEVIHEAIDRLLGFFCDQLRRRAAGTRRLSCAMYHEDLPPTRIEVRLSRPSRSARHLGDLLRGRLEASPVPAPVFAMAVWCSGPESLDEEQLTLFEAATGHRNEQAFHDLLDRLSNRLGADGVVRPEFVDDHQPERACRYAPVLATEPAERRSDGGTKEGKNDRRSGRTDPRAGGPGGWSGTPGSPPDVAGGPGERPLRILSRPVEVRVMVLVPDGPPSWFRLGAREHVIVESLGPERIETGWWRGEDIRRDYYIVTSRSGQRFWLFRERSGGRWFLHGSFD